jgi:hypothetical protein
MRTIYKIGISLGIAILGITLYFGYLGVVPGLASMFGADIPIDLGVTYTEQDRTSALAKLNIQVVALPPGAPPEESLKWSGEQQVSVTFTQEELTALLNDNWAYFPARDCQLRVHRDGVMELSGTLLPDRLNAFAEAMGASREDIGVVRDFMNVAKGPHPFYIKAQGKTINNRLANLEIMAIEMGRFNYPSKPITDNTQRITDFANWQMRHISGMIIESLRVEEGIVYFEGTVPTMKTVSPALPETGG